MVVKNNEFLSDAKLNSELEGTMEEKHSQKFVDSSVAKKVVVQLEPTLSHNLSKENKTEQTDKTNATLTVQEKRKAIANAKNKKHENVISNLYKKFKKVGVEYKEDALLDPEEKKLKAQKEKEARENLVKMKKEAKAAAKKAKEEAKAAEKKAKEEAKAAEKKAKEEAKAAEKKAKEEAKEVEKKAREEAAEARRKKIEEELKKRVTKLKVQTKRFDKAVSGLANEVAYQMSPEGMLERLQLMAHKPYRFRPFVSNNLLVNVVALPISLLAGVVKLLATLVVKNTAKALLKLMNEPIKTNEQMIELRQNRQKRLMKNVGFLRNYDKWAEINNVTDNDLMPQEVADDPKTKETTSKKGLVAMSSVLSEKDSNTNAPVVPVNNAKAKEKKNSGVGM